MAAKIGDYEWPTTSSSVNENPKAITRGEQGFTMIEMLVVIIILSVAILGMESVQLYAINQIQRGDDVATAASIAMDVTETLRTMDPATLTTVAEGSSEELVINDSAYTTSTAHEEGAGANRGGSNYYVSWTVRIDAGSGARVVDIQVRWAVTGDAMRRYTTTTIIR